MLSPTARFLRRTAATVMACAGVAQVAALWLRELTQAAVLDALLGAVYLIAAIGLFGHSRFSLFMGVVIPLGVSGAIYLNLDALEAIHNLRFATDGVIVLLCITVLLLVWHHPER